MKIIQFLIEMEKVKTNFSGEHLLADPEIQSLSKKAIDKEIQILSETKI